MAAVTIHSYFGAQEIEICYHFHFSPISLPWSDGTGCHDLSFLIAEFKPAFPLFSFTLIKILFSSSSFSSIRVVSSAHLRLLIFLCEEIYLLAHTCLQIKMKEQGLCIKKKFYVHPTLLLTLSSAAANVRIWQRLVVKWIKTMWMIHINMLGLNNANKHSSLPRNSYEKLSKVLPLKTILLPGRFILYGGDSWWLLYSVLNNFSFPMLVLTSRLRILSWLGILPAWSILVGIIIVRQVKY